MIRFDRGKRGFVRGFTVRNWLAARKKGKKGRKKGKGRRFCFQTRDHASESFLKFGKKGEKKIVGQIKVGKRSVPTIKTAKLGQMVGKEEEKREGEKENHALAAVFAFHNPIREEGEKKGGGGRRRPRLHFIQSPHRAEKGREEKRLTRSVLPRRAGKRKGLYRAAHSISSSIVQRKRKGRRGGKKKMKRGAAFRALNTAPSCSLPRHRSQFGP